MIEICLDFESVLTLTHMMIKVGRVPGAHGAVPYVKADGELVGMKAPHIFGCQKHSRGKKTKQFSFHWCREIFTNTAFFRM